MTETGVVRRAYGDHADQFVDVWTPAGPERGSILLIHGGYWRQKYGLDIMSDLAAHLARAGWTTLNVEYRRVDGSPAWPEMSADVAAAARLAPSRPVIAIGHSAGGHLALWLASQPGRLVDAVVALAPLADLRAADRLSLSSGAVRDLLGGPADHLPAVYADASPIENVPLGVPLLVVHGGEDESVPLSISLDFARAAVEAGDDVCLVSPASADHMCLIDPSDSTWRTVESFLDNWAVSLEAG